MTKDVVWKDQTLVKNYLTGVRGAIPMANEQIDVMLRVICALRPDGVTNFIDLGCGDGVLADQILQAYPNAQGILIDFSAGMLSAAEDRMVQFADQLKLVELDYGDPNWVESLAGESFDLIISGFSIHHQPDWRKKEIYQEIFDLLRPRGVFINSEHVKSASPIVENIHDQLFVDSMVAYEDTIGSGKTVDQIERDFYDRPDKEANILLDVQTQVRWLEEIGFQHADIYFKIFELSVFGGQKP
ncbi:MAG: class I SAM-dependent methyltransferase [Chloroflexota bacterium]